MKILLYNDNPVVRKLVALSAQKTKDDLNVIWSIDELDNDIYDLLIVDDALYTDEVMAELKARVPFKTTLMMATRGSSVPGGFDKVIHKPFLPTDLVELFSQIEKSISSEIEAPSIKESVKAINLEDELGDLSDTIAIDDLPDLGDFDDDTSTGIKTNILDHEEVQEVQSLLDDEDAFSLDEDILEGIGEEGDTALIDDIDEVLDEIEEENGSTGMDEELHLPELDGMDDLGDELLDELSSDGLDEAFSDDTIADSALTVSEEEALIDDLGETDSVGLALEDELATVPSTRFEDEEDLDAILGELDEGLVEDHVSAVESEDDLEAMLAEGLGEDMTEEVVSGVESEDDLDAMLAGLDENVPGEEQSHIPEMDDEDFSLDDAGLIEEELEDISQAAEDEMMLDDQGMDALEQQIQDAVSELDIGDLDMELGSEELDDLGIEALSEMDGLAGLEDIDEREMKLAVGESVEDEPEVRIGKGEHASLNAEALSEAMGDDALVESYIEDEVEEKNDTPVSPADGVEALQVLLKTLSNEEVVKSLKGLNISININFGNNS